MSIAMLYISHSNLYRAGRVTRLTMYRYIEQPEYNMRHKDNINQVNTC